MTTVGYIGGHQDYPTYDRVCSGTTGHCEAIQILFDPNIISYRDLLILFVNHHDITQTNGQGPDIGSQYLSRVYVFNSEQARISAAVLKEAGRALTNPVATTIHPACRFWPAEESHQHFLDKQEKRS